MWIKEIGSESLENLTGTGFGPEAVLGLVFLGVQDMEDDEHVALVEQVVDGPFQGPLAARGEVQRHPDLPISFHLPSRDAP